MLFSVNACRTNVSSSLTTTTTTKTTTTTTTAATTTTTPTTTNYYSYYYTEFSHLGYYAPGSANIGRLSVLGLSQMQTRYKLL